MKERNLISVENTSLGYKRRGADMVVMRDISFSLGGGDLVGLVGLNGSGKSTLLRSLCRLIPPLSGRIFLGGIPLDEISLNELSKLVSVVLTEKVGGFNLNAFDISAAGQIPYTNAFHQLKQENIDIVNSAMKVTGVFDHRFKPVNELSDGLFQKALIARSLAQQTEIMLLDEPAAFLDYASKHDLFLLLKKLATDEGKCILLSSHELDLMLKYCDKLLVAADGGVELISVVDAKNSGAFLKIAGGHL